jgi:glycosyltransferase involved in cell wall biosynthesis
MVVILTNIPTPYRTAFFNQLDFELKKSNSKLHVLYCAKTEPRRFWDFKEEDQDFEYTFLKGFHPVIKNTYPHINFSVLKALKKLNPKQLIIAGSWNTPTILFALFLYKSKAKKLFWSEGHQDAQRSKSSFISNLRKYIFKKFDGFLVPNENSRKYIYTILNSNNVDVCFLPNTIDEVFFDEELIDSKIKLREKFSIDISSRVIVLVSTLSDRKGVLQFINAYINFSSSKKLKYDVFILGTGELQEKIEKLLMSKSNKDIHLLGHVHMKQVREILKMSDIFALPTKLDPNPLTPIEASFMKKPLLLSKKAGNFNELLFENTGIAIGEINENSIEKSLNKLDLISDEELKTMGLNAYKNVFANFSREKVSINLINFLNQQKN